MSFDLVHVFQTMQPFAMAIVAVLALMFIAMITVFVERIYVYFKSRRSSRKFAHAAGPLLEAANHEGLLKVAKDYPASHLAQLLASGMKTYVAAVKKPGELDPMELTRREMVRKTEQISSDVRRGHSTLASVGSVSPFVGLLGTVIGIIAAFQGIAAEGSGGLGAVSAGIAEALVVTAIGLLVAIPAVLAFNFLSGKADALLLALEQSKGEFLDYLENHTTKAPSEAESRQSRAAA
ncbi:MAG: MotA/TolQ/ExbB proton channel family protein [Deltaproteobacteria bacterium]|nr:MotA/TolQ/ExbB proton channel family protein [Kofleriaceae bacterium]